MLQVEEKKDLQAEITNIMNRLVSIGFKMNKFVRDSEGEILIRELNQAIDKYEGKI